MRLHSAKCSRFLGAWLKDEDIHELQIRIWEHGLCMQACLILAIAETFYDIGVNRTLNYDVISIVPPEVSIPSQVE